MSRSWSKAERVDPRAVRERLARPAARPPSMAQARAAEAMREAVSAARLEEACIREGDIWHRPLPFELTTGPEPD